MSDPEEHRAAVAAAGVRVGLLSVATVGGSALLGGLVATLIGGDRYPELTALSWRFAFLGAALAMIQLEVVAGLAALRRSRLLVVLAGAAAQAAVTVLLGAGATPGALITALAAATGAVALAALPPTLTTRPSDRPERGGPLDPPAGSGPVLQSRQRAPL